VNTKDEEAYKKILKYADCYLFTDLCKCSDRFDMFQKDYILFTYYMCAIVKELYHLDNTDLISMKPQGKDDDMHSIIIIIIII
jgi:hypothetical protein